MILIGNILVLILLGFILIHFYRKAEWIWFTITCLFAVLGVVNIILYGLDIEGSITTTIETLETIFSILWSIAMVMMVAATAYLFFVKKNEELAVKFGVTGTVLLMMMFFVKELFAV